MAKYKVHLDEEGCIGCGLCESICPKTFVMGQDGRSHLKRKIILEDELEDHKTAQDGCPAEVIKIGSE